MLIGPLPDERSPIVGKWQMNDEERCIELSPMLESGPDHIFLKLEVNTKNLTDKSANLSVSDFKLIVEDGSNFGINDELMGWYKTNIDRAFCEYSLRKREAYEGSGYSPMKLDAEGKNAGRHSNWDKDRYGYGNYYLHDYQGGEIEHLLFTIENDCFGNKLEITELFPYHQIGDAEHIDKDGERVYSDDANHEWLESRLYYDRESEYAKISDSTLSVYGSTTKVLYFHVPRTGSQRKFNIQYKNELPVEFVPIE